ncbi:MAG: 2-iminoacetate synthase ThiH [Bacteroidetes bacterium]|nr:2-iminoacetate synthase ThiH [Bacteroidota bacterium]MBU1720452.1 2-iminoacetate synthase ThiH [Bacteroidota bacterium]
MNFSNIIEQYSWEEIRQAIYSKTAAEVEKALSKDALEITDFMALVSPAALPYINTMAGKSQSLTQKRFGKTIQLFIPLYLSNECTNHCVYCGFNHSNNIRRVTLTEEEVLQEAEVLKSYGYEHLLLVTGEAPGRVNVEYLAGMIRLLRPHFAHISLEVHPLEQEEYCELRKYGLNTVYVYQETYHKERYGLYHPKGKKADFNYRLDTPDRLGRAEVHRIGIGSLIGLEDWRTDAVFTALHLKYLQKMYWKSKYSISFPRLRPHAGNFIPDFVISDREMVQLITAYRLYDEFVELSISVRESKKFRDNIIKLGITSMSAGSKTDPGGYSNHHHELEQFTVHDNRTPAEFAAVIREQGYEPVWKDWDEYMQL